MTFISFLSVLVLFLGLFITQELFHRYARFSLWFFIIASIILLPCWVLLIGVDDWFSWLKVLSIAIGIIVLSLFRTTKLGNTKWCRWIVYVFLVVNILEAVLKDIQAGDLANYLNAAAGILLVVTLNKVGTIHIDKKYKDLYWDSMTFPWIIGYTIWNWVFVYLNFGLESSIQHIAVLGSALVIAFLKKERWLQARVFTLGTYFILIHSYPHFASQFSPSAYFEPFGLTAALISFGFMLTYSIRQRHSMPVKI
ncbi:MAG: DUF5692 family protein [Candidatus Altimarinota bacterium]